MPLAQFYDDYWNCESPIPEGDPTSPTRKQLISWALGGSDLSGVRVLDAGAGSGEFIEFFREMGAHTIGMDISATALRRATQRIGDAQLIQTSLDQPLPFRDDSFDVIWCSEVIEHIFDSSLAFREMSRVLRPGGQILLTTPYHGFLKNVVIAAVAFERHFDVTGPHIRFFTVGSIQRLLSIVGCKLEDVKRIGRLPLLGKCMFFSARKMPTVREHASLTPRSL